MSALRILTLFTALGMVISAGPVTVIFNSNDGWEQSLDGSTWALAEESGNFYQQLNSIVSSALWPSGIEEGRDVFYRFFVNIPGIIVSGRLWVAVDDDATIWLNGVTVFKDVSGFAEAHGPIDITAALMEDLNEFEAVAVSTFCCGRGFAPYLEITYVDASTVIPEPGTMGIGAAALAAVLAFRRR